MNSQLQTAETLMMDAWSNYQDAITMYNLRTGFYMVDDELLMSFIMAVPEEHLLQSVTDWQRLFESYRDDYASLKLQE
jgi:hypothetical protein